MLERMGYAVTARTSSMEALTTFRNQPDAFDLVITDQTMPGMTGIDLARKMLQLRPDLPIILCTGYSSRLSKEQVRAYGIKGFALKPLAKKDIAEMKKTMVSSLIMVFALTLPASAGLIVLAEPIIRLIFEHGAFTAVDTLATAETLALYSIGLFAYSANKVLVPAFYALDKTRYPVIASFIAIVANIIIITLTIDRFQHLAIAFSTSCTMLLNFLFLMTVLYINLNGFSLAYLGKSLLKIAFATLALAGLLWKALPYFRGWLHGSIIAQSSSLFILIMTAILLYGALLHITKLAEMDILTAMVRSKFLKRE